MDFKSLSEKSNSNSVVIVCFGTTNISGDALGPRVGSLLRDKYGVKAFVYGTENAPINGKNMREWTDFIRTVHRDSTFVAVDASLGERGRVGQILLRSDGVCPAAVKGRKSRFGDVGVLGVVGENKGDALMQLMQVPVLYVCDLADKVAELVSCALI